MLVVGHRGAPNLAPENTRASFEAAIVVGVDAIELDVQASRDGHLVVIHDATLERTTDGRGPVHERSLAELKALDAGSWLDLRFAGERIPTFEEALGCIGRRTGLQVEIKGRSDGLVEATLAALAAHSLLDGVLVTSFQLERLPLVRAQAPAVAIGALIHERRADGRPMSPSEAADAARAAGADVLLLWHEQLDEAAMAAGRAAGLAVGAFGGPATEADMRRITALGAVRMTSNYPDVFRRVVDEMARGA
jgi:glycerophosphoryl diester phosphodiesterase